MALPPTHEYTQSHTHIKTYKYDEQTTPPIMIIYLEYKICENIFFVAWEGINRNKRMRMKNEVKVEDIIERKLFVYEEIPSANLIFIAQKNVIQLTQVYNF